MGVLHENPTWESPIYLIERHDPVMGGEQGINNVQARQLANRTQYLRALFLLEHLYDGRHALTERSIARDAAIAESKLALPESTEGLYTEVLHTAKILADLNRALDSVEGLDGTPLKAIYEALIFSWRYGYPRFSFDMFTRNFSLRDIFDDIPLQETIAGDDSIDVEDSSPLTVGETYIIWDRDKSQSTIVTIKEILTEHRVILWEEENRTRYGNGFLTKSSWLVEAGRATALPDAYYITGFSDLLDGFDRGRLLISHTEDVTFTVDYRAYGSTRPSDWQPVAMLSKEYSEEAEQWRSVFQIPGGILAFKIHSSGETPVDHIAIMTDTAGALPSTVRTPVIVDPAFRTQRFGALYGAQHVQTEVALSDTREFIGNEIVIQLPASDNALPVWDLKTYVLGKYPMTEGESVYWRVRYKADDGYWSLWSAVSMYTHTA